jgi:hypothetical protein
MVDKRKKEVVVAERNELEAKKKYEFAIEYTKLCKEQLAKAEEDAKQDTSK